MTARERLRRAVYVDPDTAERLQAERSKLGIDRWDEVWDGELHMNPPPSGEHSRVEYGLIAFLVPYLEEKRLGIIRRLAVRRPGTGERNYRVPEFCFIATGSESKVDACWFDGGPEVVFEVRSPGDETYEKLDFYGEVGVRDLVVIDRDTKRVELFSRRGDRLVAVSPAPDGTLLCEPLGVCFRSLPRGAFEIFVAADPARRAEI